MARLLYLFFSPVISLSSGFFLVHFPEKSPVFSLPLTESLFLSHWTELLPYFSSLSLSHSPILSLPLANTLFLSYSLVSLFSSRRISFFLHSSNLFSSLTRESLSLFHLSILFLSLPPCLSLPCRFSPPYPTRFLIGVLIVEDISEGKIVLTCVHKCYSLNFHIFMVIYLI